MEASKEDEELVDELLLQTESQTSTENNEKHKSILERIRTNTHIPVLVVGFAFFTDYLLLLSCVPILPFYAELLHLSNIDVGIIFSSKSIAQIISNPIMGIISDRFGRRIPMLVGLLVLSLSTVLFAFGNSYFILVFARFFQGVASSANMTAGMALLADCYPDSAVRAKMMSRALMALSLGVLCGAPYGGITFQLGGPRLPFLIIAGLVFLDGIARAVLLRDPPRVITPKNESEPTEENKWKKSIRLLTDPQILATTLSLFLGNALVAMFEATLSLYLSEVMGYGSLVVGLLYAIQPLVYSVCMLIVPKIPTQRWHILACGLLIMGVCSTLILVFKHIAWLITFWALLGIGMSYIDATGNPILADIADKRHPNSYGRVYAIGSTGVNIGFIVGPVIGTAILKPIGYQLTWVLYGSVAILFVPLILIIFGCSFCNNPRKDVAFERLVDSTLSESQ